MATLKLTGSLVFVLLPHVGLVQFPTGLPNSRSREAWRLTQAGPWFPSIGTVQTGAGPRVCRLQEQTLSGKAGKNLSCFLRRWEEAGGGSPEEELPVELSPPFPPPHTPAYCSGKWGVSLRLLHHLNGSTEELPLSLCPFGPNCSWLLVSSSGWLPCPGIECEDSDTERGEICLLIPPSRKAYP